MAANLWSTRRLFLHNCRSGSTGIGVLWLLLPCCCTFSTQLGRARCSINVPTDAYLTTRRVGPEDLPPGPRQFFRRRCVLVRGRWVRNLSWGQSRRRWPKPPQLKQPSLLPTGRTAVRACLSSFRESLPTSPTSVFSGFGLLVCDCRLWWKSSSARITLLTSFRASARVDGSCSSIAIYACFEVIPPAKRATRSRSDTPALRPTSATSWAYCLMVWNRWISCPVVSSGPYVPSNRFLNSSKEISFACPAG
ncbi:hypothetical protein T09_34 [Trichinella sp. T9]|nr:hypothetical protein T09_34 [Trichinella sp. T9]